MMIEEITGKATIEFNVDKDVDGEAEIESVAEIMLTFGEGENKVTIDISEYRMGTGTAEKFERILAGQRRAERLEAEKARAEDMQADLRMGPYWP